MSIRASEFALPSLHQTEFLTTSLHGTYHTYEYKSVLNVGGGHEEEEEKMKEEEHIQERSCRLCK